jgi:DNA-binding SARP family transcriptional activator
VVHVHLLGGAAVHRGRRPTDVAAWQRGRVRELALHLATRRDVGRDAVAAALWPDLDARSASRNLRVTLSHLLDVLDPDRERGQSSVVLVDAAANLHLAEVDWLRVDVTELEQTAQEVLGSAAAGDLAGALAACRRLLRFDAGPLLGGATTGEWLEPIRRHLDELVLRAAEVGAGLALEVGEAALAGELGRRMVVVDPWTESGHRLVIAAHLAAGEFDAARRAVTETLAALGALGVTPRVETLALAHRAGWRRPPATP